MGLEGKFALITGAGSGIGRASAVRMAKAGASVMCADLDTQSAEGTVAIISEAGGKADSIGLDVSEEEQVKEAIAKTAETMGGFNVLFNNAGVGGGFTWDQTIAINLSGVAYGLYHGARYFAANGGGAIINTASIAGLVGLTAAPNGTLAEALEDNEGGNAYIAAKHGVAGLTKQYAITFGRHGVRVNAIAPALIYQSLGKNTTAVPNSKKVYVEYRVQLFGWGVDNWFLTNPNARIIKHHVHSTQLFPSMIRQCFHLRQLSDVAHCISCCNILFMERLDCIAKPFFIRFCN